MLKTPPHSFFIFHLFRVIPELHICVLFLSGLSLFEISTCFMPCFSPQTTIKNTPTHKEKGRAGKTRPAASIPYTAHTKTCSLPILLRLFSFDVQNLSPLWSHAASKTDVSSSFFQQFFQAGIGGSKQAAMVLSSIKDNKKSNSSWWTQVTHAHPF